MTQLIVHKDKMQDILMAFLSRLQSDEIRMEFDETHFLVEPVQERSVLDILAEQADDLGLEDLSMNVDHYLYGLPMSLIMTETMTFEVSQDLLASLKIGIQDLAQEIRLMAAITYFQEKKLSLGKAADLAGCNLIITGPTGAGKTWLACAFGVAACRSGIGTSYVRLSRLLHDLGIGKADGSYKKQLDKLARTELLIIDDWGMSPLTDTAKCDILEIMEDRHNVRSTLVSTQYPVSEWHRLIDDPTLADAICDRLVHNAYQITLKGESMRKLMANMS